VYVHAGGARVAAGACVFPWEVVCPVLTFAAWVGVLAFRTARGRGGAHVVEWLAIIACVVVRSCSSTCTRASSVTS